MSDHRASLYVVATPIGNLADVTLRALEVLRGVDAVVSENVQKTRNLLARYDITTRVLSYREENAKRMGGVVLGMLERGESVALVAEAGTPGVSDPGRQLVDAAWRRGFAVVPVPGASAAVAAISVAGMDEPRFVFEGFLPRRGSKRRQRLGELAADSRPLVLFEAPHRLLECLEDIKEVLGDRRCVVAREITKIHEEVVRDRVSSFIARYTESRPIGEFVIVCEGSAGAGPGSGKADPGEALRAAVAEARELVAGGARAREAAKTVAKRRGLKARDIYAGLIGKGDPGMGDRGKGQLGKGDAEGDGR
jgi:16S rRNA (cytidine1402-2'-O)-methyltransferase